MSLGIFISVGCGMMSDRTGQGSGAASGTESGPAKDQSQQGSGGTVPIGVPVSEEELRRLKEKAAEADRTTTRPPAQHDR